MRRIETSHSRPGHLLEVHLSHGLGEVLGGLGGRGGQIMQIILVMSERAHCSTAGRWLVLRASSELKKFLLHTFSSLLLC